MILIDGKTTDLIFIGRDENNLFYFFVLQKMHQSFSLETYQLY